MYKVDTEKKNHSIYGFFFGLFLVIWFVGVVEKAKPLTDTHTVCLSGTFRTDGFLVLVPFLVSFLVPFLVPFLVQVKMGWTIFSSLLQNIQSSI